MGNGAWSNDRQNSIIIYDAVTGQVILQVDQDGFYFANSANGAYFDVDTDNPFGNAQVVLQPPNSAAPGATYTLPAGIVAGENLSSPTDASGYLELSSPAVNNKLNSEILLYSQSSGSASDNSQIVFLTGDMVGVNFNEMSMGTVDVNGVITPGTNFTTTETLILSLVQTFGTMTASRFYEAAFNTLVQSTVATDRIGLRIYSNTSASLVGATLIADYGQTSVDAANIGKPVRVDAAFAGIPNAFIILAARRATGSGTCTVTVNYSKLADVCFN